MDKLEKVEMKDFISAEEARKICDASPTTLNRIFKAIKESAREGSESLKWELENASSKAIDVIIEKLQVKGFKVEAFYDSSEEYDFSLDASIPVNRCLLNISW